jgi:hypothetical protein
MKSLVLPPAASILFGIAPWIALVFLDTGHHTSLFLFTVSLFAFSIATGIIGSRSITNKSGRRLLLVQSAANGAMFLLFLGIAIASI